VVVAGEGAAALVLSAEAATAETLDHFAAVANGGYQLAVTARRANVLGLNAPEDGAVLVDGAASAEEIRRLADPCWDEGATAPAAVYARPVDDRGPVAAAVALAKIARLLPAVVVAPLGDAQALAARQQLFIAEAADILGYQVNTARSLRIVGDARVPLVGAENTRIVAFRPSDGGVEHLAIVIGEPDGARPVLARLHSECFTGDLLGSLRCDCGDQLRGAIGEIAADGGGVLLYLAQEGRGIGLVNKLRAYRLQDVGFDTLDANGQLGFDDDERIYQPAAEMLRLLGIGRVRLLTNNPLKVGALAEHGIEVTERVPHVFPANDHNRGYLRTKSTKGGHLF